jgi:hypothetical protein
MESTIPTQVAGPASALVSGRGFMKRLALIFVLLLSAGSYLMAAPLATAARSVIPKEVQQIISVDYRSLKASPTALALKERVLPPNMKEFETALRDLGIDPDKEVESLVFASFRTPKQGLRIIGIAQGQFPTKLVLKRMRLKKVQPTKYGNSLIYPLSATEMVFLDDFTLLFGDAAGLRAALDAQNGETETLASNTQIVDMISSADSGPIWSVLDAQGTQNMMRSALGEASKLADYETVKKRLLGSRYVMDFTNGVTFDLDVITSDSMTAATMSALLKAGLMFRRSSATGAEKTALEAVTVDSDSSRLLIHFKTDDKKFQSLLQSDLFAAVSR